MIESDRQTSRHDRPEPVRPDPPNAPNAPRAVPVRLGARSSGPLRVFAALAIFIAVALVKPWGSPTGPRAGGFESGRAGTPSARASGGAVAGAAEESVAPAPAAATSCLSSDAEQLVVFERWPGNEIRSWIAVPEVSATGPLDPALRPVTVYAAHTVGIGVCAPTTVVAPSPRAASPSPSVEHAAEIVDVQVVGPGSSGSTLVDLGAPTELAAIRLGVDAVRLYRPASGSPADEVPPESAPPARSSQPRASAAAGDTGARDPSAAASAGSWRLGGYAIGFRYAFDAGGTTRWLRFELARGGGS